MGNALFIVWRESAEAMLVVGILYAWLKRRSDATIGMRYLWGGVAALHRFCRNPRSTISSSR
jgi:high-affinity iron transporter